jgi:hypothetical protein
MLDELSIGDIVFWFLLVFERLAWEHVKAEDLLHLALRLLHTNLINLAAECLTLIRQTSEEFTRQKNLTVVSVTKLIDSEGNLSVR